MQGVRPEAPFSLHTVIYHQKTLLLRREDERLLGSLVGLPRPCWEITVMGEERIQ